MLRRHRIQWILPLVLVLVLVSLMAPGEVFAQEGVYSYSEQFAFTPERDDLELISDGTVKLVSMELHEIKRTWK